MTGDIAFAPRRQLRGRFWHQGPTRYPLGSFADPATSDGRYHRRGGAGVWYASDREQAAWAELFRHFTDEGVGPFEVRRVGAVHVAGLKVLDLTDEVVRSSLGISLEDLTGDDYARAQEVADAARAAGFGGILAPSAAIEGRRTLVVFASGWRPSSLTALGSGNLPRAWQTSCGWSGSVATCRQPSVASSRRLPRPARTWYDAGGAADPSGHRPRFWRLAALPFRPVRGTSARRAPSSADHLPVRGLAGPVKDEGVLDVTSERAACSSGCHYALQYLPP